MIHRSIDERHDGWIRAAVQGKIEVRTGDGDAKGTTVVGYASIFDEPTELWPGYREVIRPGAFKKTLREADVRGLFNHDPNFLLGRTKSGTLRLEEDAHGLRYEIDLPDTATIRDLVAEPLKRGDLDASSFAFRAVKDRETAEQNGDDLITTREVIEAELFDVSPVTYPAYEGTEAELRAAMQMRAASSVGQGTAKVFAKILGAAGLRAADVLQFLERQENERGEEPQRGEPSLDLRRRKLVLLEMR